MKSDSQVRRRRSIRLKHYDYSQPGAYFITVVTKNRDCLFGKVNCGQMQESEFGKIVQEAWSDLPHHYPYITLDEFILMPNHVHAILVLNAEEACKGGSISSDKSKASRLEKREEDLTFGIKTRPYKTIRHGIPEIVRAFKSFSSRRINNLRGTPGLAVWQRNFYDHIIRNQYEFNNIRLYITENPYGWNDDHENPDKLGGVEVDKDR